MGRRAQRPVAGERTPLSASQVALGMALDGSTSRANHREEAFVARDLGVGMPGTAH